MARQTREEWLAGLQPGDVISCTFPGDHEPSIGKVHEVNGPMLLGEFPGHHVLRRFASGALLGAPESKLWMVATGHGNSTGPRIVVSNQGPGLSLGVESVDDGR